MPKHYSFIYIALILLFCATSTLNTKNNLRQKIITVSKKYIGTNYKYGGNTPKGFDCSGFTQYIYKQIGIQLPHNAALQYRRGSMISLNKALPGDLIFFKINFKTISHTGIYLGNNQFIHSPRTGAKVRIESLRIPYWKNRYAGIKKIL